RIVDGPDAAANGERDEDLSRGAVDQIGHDFAGVARCGDVEKDQLVGTLVVVARCEFDRIASVAEAHEVDAFYDAAAGDIKTGDDTLGQHLSELDEVAHDFEADWTGFFRVKLHAEHIAGFEYGGVGGDVVARRRGSVDDWCVVAMREVEIW